ncbi:hypothetical protein [Xenorhabdus hominickii]|uniref:Polynucleotide kinase n=1 Tax=Xenorhabdus hominickii TaxID=351679 RepID=A0A1V0M417_XENHO|nr:hypothetical protein [Xenorhabdus hominickii]ARD69614.1 hypothetical protein [Xenorhabdus hominickii]PHM52328.1 hypothetical protein Xhom_04405 [Xenorhabdus hominickii]
MQPLVICTLDGVLSDNTDRLHLMKDGSVIEYHERHSRDEAIISSIRMLKGFQRTGCDIVIVDDRPIEYQEETEAWLKEYGVFFDYLYLPKPKEAGRAFKMKAIREHLKENGGQILAVICHERQDEHDFRNHPHRPVVYSVSRGAV